LWKYCNNAIIKLFNDEDKALIKNYTVHRSRKVLMEFPGTKWNKAGLEQFTVKNQETGSTDRSTGVEDRSCRQPTLYSSNSRQHRKQEKQEQQAEE